MYDFKSFTLPLLMRCSELAGLTVCHSGKDLILVLKGMNVKTIYLATSCFQKVKDLTKYNTVLVKQIKTYRVNAW